MLKVIENDYNTPVHIAALHGWALGLAEAAELQRRLASLISPKDEALSPRYIAGVDVSVGRATRKAVAAVVVLTYPEMELAEVRLAQGEVTFPYVPGFLSFRELPLVLEACAMLTITPDLVMVDGQGLSHPRRLGIASHLGLFLSLPTIGCAKSPLLGHFEMPLEKEGCFTGITDRGEVVGAALKTKVGCRPLFVSVGHKVSLEYAVSWVVKCLCGYRLPEPSRLAHLAAGGNLKRDSFNGKGL